MLRPSMLLMMARVSKDVSRAKRRVEPTLTYALQRGGPWRTVRRYDAEKYEFSFVQKVMRRGRAKTPGYRWRILLMPFNVWADEI